MTGRTKPWYRDAFEADYLELYSHRTDAAAAAEVAWLQGLWQLPPSSTLLDLACGNGRHAAAWTDVDIDVVGVDLSRSLLDRAVERRLGRARFLCADMAAIPLRRAFDAATSFFTSFGYFETEEADRRVLEEIARVLNPGGRFILDFLNASRVRATLVPHSHEVRDGVEIDQHRSISGDGTRVEKAVTWSRDGASFRRTTESVRLYERADLERLLDSAGIETDATWGSLRGDPHDDDASRLVLTGRRR